MDDEELDDEIVEEKKDIIKPTDESALHKIRAVDATKYLDAFEDYKAAKETLDTKIIENENWFKQEYWQYLKDEVDGNEPTSGTLLNGILNKHADFMDNEPAPVFLAREPGDEEEAEKLTKIIPVILKNCNWNEVYDKYCMYKIKQGMGCISATWDDSLENGLGDIVINYIDILRMFWEPNCTNIQDSRYVFVTSLIDTDILKDQYELSEDEVLFDEGGGQGAYELKSYDGSDQNILTKKTLVLDCYERSISDDGRQMVHLTKIANGKVLESSIENEDTAETGIYAHGKYPFIFGQYIPLEGTLEGMGLIDIGKNSQGYTDKIDVVALQNAIVASKQRYLVKKDGGINPADVMDLSKDVIESSTSVDDSAIRPLQAQALPAFIPQLRENKIQELKEATGNRDFNSGGTAGGVTAMGAIAALQEAGNKTSRDETKTNYREFEKLITIVVELVREFYVEDRLFRITGDDSKPEYETFNNSNLVNQISNQDEMFSTLPDGQAVPNEKWVPEYRKPVFDINIIAQKENPFNTISHNQTMLDLFKLGAFNPEMAVASTILIENMIFEGKEKILTKVRENGDMFQQLQQMQIQMQQMQQQYTQAAQQQDGKISQLQGFLDKSIKSSTPLNNQNSL